MRPDIIIAIDPDTDKSGVAVLDLRSRKVDLYSLPFMKLSEFLRDCKTVLAGDIVVYVEAGWLIKHHWHLNKGDNSRTAAAKGNSAGRNHEVGRKIAEMARYCNLTTIEQLPLSKTFRVGRKRYNIWKGPAGKITHEEFCEITGYAGRTNQETRDAGLIAWQMAGFPIIIKPRAIK